MADVFACQPSDINTKVRFFDAFQHVETEISAGWIVRFCQARGKGWEPFTFADIDGFYKSKGMHDGFWFNRLLSNAFIVEKEGMYHITPDFVSRCFKSSPAK